MDSILKKLPGPRILVGAAALLLVLVYFTPLWTIYLTAPQYPDGMGMYIGVSEIRGHDTHDLQNINILNHYIGMQPIEPENVPELDIMPIVLGALVITGLLAAIIGNRWLMAAWLAAFLLAGAAGMVDFYLWKHDYGHNLSPDAPIKVPGMTYQPPLIGTKQLLNITASSYPHLGTLFLSLAALLGLAGVASAFRGPGHREERKPASRARTGDGPGNPGAEGAEAGADASYRTGVRRSGAGGRRGPEASAGARTVGLALLAAVLLAGCGPGNGEGARQGDDSRPDRGEAIVYGEDVDPFCGREVATVRWGGEIRTDTGDRLRFRSVECLAGFLLSGRLPEGAVERVLVVDFADGWRLIDAGSATYLRTPNLASPDRVNLLALDSPGLARNLQDAYTGPLIGWNEVLDVVGQEWNEAIRAGGCEATEAAAERLCE